ncbi:hypothetical protein [Sorangium sp. So ce388]|uniref:hypothetical protein n=1 Tax=Sorangium sp. So ce388 TaxID=3133309 RepID=UPI003F5B489D
MRVSSTDEQRRVSADQSRLRLIQALRPTPYFFGRELAPGWYSGRLISINELLDRIMGQD